jgi:hypothetical protein
LFEEFFMNKIVITNMIKIPNNIFKTDDDVLVGGGFCGGLISVKVDQFDIECGGVKGIVADEEGG